MIGRERPILLKKSAMVSTAEKYALEIEIFTLSRGFQAQISRSCTQRRDFQQSVCGRSGKTDFFNRIGQKRTVILATPPNSSPSHDK
jgi:hypothetical protein